MQESLVMGEGKPQLEFNVIADSCGGCPYHNYPYRAQVPIAGTGFRDFASDDDVWEVIDLLIEDVKFTNEKLDKDFDTSRSVLAQIPFLHVKMLFITKSVRMILLDMYIVRISVYLLIVVVLIIILLNGLKKHL